MNPEFHNVYADHERAKAYSDLEFPGSYYLAFRDLPAIFERHVSGRAALDFGCGAGRSSRFLKDLDFQVVGVDIAEHMLSHATERDPEGDYRLLADGDLSELEGSRFDLVLCAFTFDSMPRREKRQALFEGFGNLLSEGGRIVNLVSDATIYVREWTSFSTKDFPENRSAKSGDHVHLVMLDVPDRRPVEDVFWDESDYRELYTAADLELIEVHRPLGKASDPFSWVSESEVSPWAIYTLGRSGESREGAGK